MLNERIRRQLLDYVLDALDDDEHAAIEQRIAAEPALQEELEVIVDQLLPLAGEDAEDVEPPSRLAERTCSLVDAHADAHSDLPEFQPAPIVLSQGRIGEFLVAAGMFLAVALLFFPAISNSREMARLAQCHNNLRQLGIAMSIYCDLSGGYFPHVPAAGKRAFAGIYAPILHDAGYFSDESLLVCSSSSLAEQPHPALPSLSEIDAADADQLIAWRRFAGGSYGYSIGVIENGRYRPARNRGRSHFAVMADAPAISLAGYSSQNHGGSGLNLLYEDGRVSYLTQPDANPAMDHPFCNFLGVVEPGVTNDDAVVAPPYAPPFSHRVNNVGDQ